MEDLNTTTTHYDCSTNMHPERPGLHLLTLTAHLGLLMNQRDESGEAASRESESWMTACADSELVGRAATSAFGGFPRVTLLRLRRELQTGCKLVMFLARMKEARSNGAIA